MNDAQFGVWNTVNNNFKLFTDVVVINNRVQCLAELSARNHSTMLAATKAFGTTIVVVQEALSPSAGHSKGIALWRLWWPWWPWFCFCKLINVGSCDTACSSVDNTLIT